MFEKIGRLAETAATGVSVSRRAFLGRLGKGGLAVAGVLAGALAFPGQARAGGSGDCIGRCCEATCGKGDTRCSCDPSIYGICYWSCMRCRGC